jgi:hypothetical protein
VAGERTIRIRFDGSARGLANASRDAERQVERATSAIERKAGAFARIGQKIGLDLTSGITGAFKSAPPQVQAAAVGLAAFIGTTMSAAVGAALTAGILLAVGGGVLAAGIKAAANSPQVQAAWKRFGERGKKVFDAFGKPFEGPVSRALDTFGTAIERMEPTFKRMGESMAPIIDKLAPALASMAEKSLPGIERAMEASKPLWDTLAEHAPDIGEAISSFFDSISEGGPEANLLMKDFLTWLEGIIIVLGKVIGFLARLYGKAREVWTGIASVFAEGVRVVLAVLGKIIGGAAAAFGWIPGIGPKLKTAAAEFDEFQRKANHELDKITGKTVHVDVSLRGIKNIEEQVAVRLGRRASGGHTQPGRSYLVGENGPEVLTMGRTPGYVTPNGQLGGTPEVRVFIGDQELRGMVRVEVSEHNRGLKRRALAGAGAGR